MMSTITTPTIDPTTDAWRDYVAVVSNGMRPTDRATERGITGATVSANVRRIRDAIAAGASLPSGDHAPDDNGVTSVFPTFTAWVADTYDADTALAVDMIGDALGTVNRDRARAVSARDDADARITAADDRVGTVTAMFDRIAPDGVASYDALRDAYTAARDASVPTPDDA